MPSFRVLLASDRAGLKNFLLSQPRAQSCTRRLNRAFIIGTVLNVGFVVIEAFFGIVTQSRRCGSQSQRCAWAVTRLGTQFSVSAPPDKMLYLRATSLFYFGSAV